MINKKEFHVKVFEEDYGCGNMVVNKAEIRKASSEDESMEDNYMSCGSSTAEETEWRNESSEEDEYGFEGDINGRNVSNGGTEIPVKEREGDSREGNINQHCIVEEFTVAGGNDDGVLGVWATTDAKGEEDQESGTYLGVENGGLEENLKKRSVMRSNNDEGRIPRCMENSYVLGEQNDKGNRSGSKVNVTLVEYVVKDTLEVLSSGINVGPKSFNISKALGSNNNLDFRDGPSMVNDDLA